MSDNVTKEGILVEKDKFLFAAHPVEDCLYGIEVAVVKKGRERHFVLTKSDGSGKEPLIQGHEAATCLQVMTSFADTVAGLSIEDIHFYGCYDGAWCHVSFTKWELTKIRRAWPECDSGAALGEPIIHKLNVRDMVSKPLKNDFTPHPFSYWWHAVSASNQLAREYGDEILNHLRQTVRDVPFGDISYQATEARSCVSLFAKHKQVLNRRIRADANGATPVYVTPITKTKGGNGWAAIVVLFDRLQIDCHIYEPGHHQVDDGEFHFVRVELEHCGVAVETISASSWRVVLPTEFDLSKGSLPHSNTLFRRGTHVFELIAEAESEDDI